MWGYPDIGKGVRGETDGPVTIVIVQEAEAVEGMTRLYERTAEIEAIDTAVSSLPSGRGASLLLEARAGRGKTTLMEYAVAAAREAGARTLVARARHLTSAAPYEVLRRLLGPAVEDAGGAEALTGASRFAAPLFTPGAELTEGVDYGCQWLIARLAEQAPLLLAVDDAHWADSASLRVLLDVQAEISVQPVLLLLASRPVENPSAQPLLAAMASHPDNVLLTPGLLTREAVADLVVEQTGVRPDDAFVDECLRVSRGNAFYVRELLRQHQAAAEAQQTVPARTTLSLRRTVAARLGELGPDATGFAQAAAVLGDGCSLTVAAELAGLEHGDAVREAARLEVSSILTHGDPVEFLHPLIRHAVEDGLPEVARGELHARAAQLLWQNDELAGSVAEHLVVSPGAGDARVSAFLAEQGHEALASGSVAAAVRLLRRALDEPAPADQRDLLLVRLGRAEVAQGRLEAAQTHLREALESADRAVALTAAAELIDVVVAEGRYDDMVPLHARALTLRPYGHTDAEVRLRAQLLINNFMAVAPDLEPLPTELTSIDAPTLPLDRGVDRYLMVVAAVHGRSEHGHPAEWLVANLRRAVDSMPADPAALTAWDVRAVLAAATFLGSEELEESMAMLDRVAPVVVRLGGTAPDLQAELDHRRIMGALATGSFEDALARLDVAEEFIARHRLVAFDGFHRSSRGWVALERGDYPTAAAMLSERTGDDTVSPALGALLGGDADLAIALLGTLDLSVDPEAEVRAIEVELEPHLVASHAFEVLGDRDRAAAEAQREVTIRRRYGAAPQLAMALRRQASFLPARESVPVLEEALGLVESSPRRAVRARVLASYGAALRRASRTQEARDVLYRAADLADEMGMRRLRDRAQRELAAAGARPRRTRLHGPDSLTATQSEVAALAAQGLTNREIAERLFVTIKTVETHLMAIYRKLGIRTRDALAETLEREVAVVGAP